MTSYERPVERPATGGRLFGYDHMHFWVANAKQAAAWYVLRMGFDYVAYAGLETGSRDVATHVIRQNDIVFAFSSPLNPVETDIGRRLLFKGDAIKDVAYTVEDCKALFEKAVSRGAVPIREPTELKDENGSVIIATVQTYGDTVHSFVQRSQYTGPFLPGFRSITAKDPIAAILPDPGLRFIDHIVGNQGDLEMEAAAQWYEKVLDFHRFWSVDDSQIHTEYSALRSVVMADFDEKIKMPINEPAAGKKKSQIQEYVEYHGGAGVQHVALNTPDVITAVANMRARGCEFLRVPHEYYVDVRKRLAKSPLQVKESLDRIEELGILIDFDDNGYLLQLFTKPAQDRPTLFYEVIQRNNHEGFGAGNFKALFEAIEREQAERGNLENDRKDNTA